MLPQYQDAKSEPPETKLNEDNVMFSVTDYIVFSAMLIISAGSGVYHYFWGKGQKSTTDYLLGGRDLSPFPVAMSLVASYISGVTLLGTPADVYKFGTQYYVIVLAIVAMGATVATVFLPVFCNLRLQSSYQYLEMRFNNKVRMLASIEFVLDEILFMPIVIYVPALAFNQVTGVNIYLIGFVVSIVCIFYTTLGGLRAVVWTDTLQILLMCVSVLLVLIIGTMQVGGIEVVFERSNMGKRLEIFNFNPSPYERHTVWSLLIGGFFYWTAYNAVNQTMVQRYLSLPSLQVAQKSIMIFVTGIIVIISICCYLGILIFAAYHDCDPLESKAIADYDQLLPYFMMQTVGSIPGLPGLFMAGIFSAALSSLSTILNSLPAVILADFLKSLCQIGFTENRASLVAKMLVVAFGLLSVACLFLVEPLEGILQVTTSLTAIAASTTFGMFALGMLFPWANYKGVLCGALVASIVVAWMSLGTQVAAASGAIYMPTLEISTKGCINLPDNMTASAIPLPQRMDHELFFLYRLSYQWHAPIGVLTVLIIGILVSWITGFEDPEEADPVLFSPVVRKYCPQLGVKRIVANTPGLRLEAICLAEALERSANEGL